MRLSVQLCLLLLLGLSCKTSRSSNPSPAAPASPPPKVQFAAQPNAVVVTFDPQSTDTSDSRKITACEVSSGNCTDVNTARDQEVIPLPEKGTYTVDISTCQQMQCQPTGQQQTVQIAQTDLQDASINQEIAQLKQTLPSDLAAMREILTQLQTLYTNAHNDKAQAAMGTLLGLNDAALSYLLSDLADLPLSDPTALDLLAQEAQQHAMDPTGSQTNIDNEPNTDPNSDTNTDPNSNIDTTVSTDGTTDSTNGGGSNGNSSALTAANALIGVAVIFGTVAVGFFAKGAISRMQYFKKVDFSKIPFIGDTTAKAEIKAGTVGEVGSKILVFNGAQYTLPEGYTVAAISENTSVLDEKGNTRSLGAGSQGTAFAVEHEDVHGKKTAKIIKLPNSANKLLEANSQTLTEVQEGFQAEDVDVAEKMQQDFKNPMEASLSEVTGPNGKRVPAVIKDRIAGVTLKKALENGDFFKSEGEAVKMRQDLQYELFQRMSVAKLVYGDLNPANLMWNGKQWVIIDAKPPTTAASYKEALQGNFDSFTGKLAVDANGRVILRDQARITGVARYTPVYENETIKLLRDAQLMTFLQNTKQTIEGDREGLTRNALFEGDVKISPEKVNANILKLKGVGKTDYAIGGIFGVLAAGAAVAAGVLSSMQLSAAPTQEQTLLEKLGTLQMKVASTLHTIDAYTAWYVKTEQ